MSATAPAQPAPPPRPVDPRVRARWIAARREEGRRRLRVVVVVVAVVVSVIVAWGITVSPLLAVEEIEVVGTARSTAESVIAAAQVGEGDSMVWLDPDEVTARIEASPWILTAHVERDWPRTLIVKVTERSAVAWTEVEGGSSVVVDGGGRVLERADAPPPGLPQLVDLTSVPEPGGTVAPSSSALVAAKYGVYAPAVRQIATTGGGVVVTLFDGPEVRLGRPSRLTTKLRAAGAVLDALRDSLPTYVDVSVPTNPVAG